MNVRLLAAVMITGIDLSGSSAYLKAVFADDQWSQVEERQLMAQERAALVYTAKYTDNNIEL